MKKIILLVAAMLTTSIFAETESICVDKTQVEQTVTALKHIATALAALAQKVEMLLNKEQEKTPKRSLDFGAWQEVVQQNQNSRPTREDQQESNSGTTISDDQE